jgi:hypothetical protein
MFPERKEIIPWAKGTTSQICTDYVFWDARAAIARADHLSSLGLAMKLKPSTATLRGHSFEIHIRKPHIGLVIVYAGPEPHSWQQWTWEDLKEFLTTHLVTHELTR